MYPVPVWPNPCYATELSGLYFSDIFGSYFLLKCLIHILLQPNGDFMIYNACDFGLQRFRDSKIRVCWKKFVFLVYIHTSRSFRTLWPSGKLFRPHFGSQHPIIVLIWKNYFQTSCCGAQYSGKFKCTRSKFRRLLGTEKHRRRVC